MDHLTAEQIIDLIGGDEPPGARAHLNACSTCRELHETWLRRMDSLRDLERYIARHPAVTFVQTSLESAAIEGARPRGVAA